MSVLHQPQNANNAVRRRNRIVTMSVISIALIVSGVLLVLRTSSPPTGQDITPPAPTLAPYLDDPAPPSTPPTPEPEPPEPDHASLTVPDPSPPSPVLAPNPFFPEPEPSPTPLSEPLPDDAPAPAPFDSVAIENQGAELGPSAWMARLPGDQSAQIDEIIDVARTRIAAELDTQERERMLHAHVSQLITSAALRCAAHDLSARARIVVHVARIPLLDAHGRLFGVDATANTSAGGRAMQRCLLATLEGRHFDLSLADTIVQDAAFIVGEAR